MKLVYLSTIIILYLFIIDIKTDIFELLII